MKKLTQPDQWERIATIVAKLLRREHLAIVRMVQNEKLPHKKLTNAGFAYNHALDNVLAKLKARGQ